MKVTFDKGTPSPFSEPAYTIQAGGAEQTKGGPVKGSAGRTYKYNVRNARDEITDDPDVDVE